MPCKRSHPPTAHQRQRSACPSAGQLTGNAHTCRVNTLAWQDCTSMLPRGVCNLFRLSSRRQEYCDMQMPALVLHHAASIWRFDKRAKAVRATGTWQYKFLGRIVANLEKPIQFWVFCFELCVSLSQVAEDEPFLYVLLGVSDSHAHAISLTRHQSADAVTVVKIGDGVCCCIVQSFSGLGIRCCRDVF